MLLLALNPDNPYGYYILLRWVCCAVFAFLALHAFTLEKIGWVWVFGVTAAIYNPILRVTGSREMWSIINIVTIGLAIVSIIVLKKIRNNNTTANEYTNSVSQRRYYLCK